MHLYLHILTDKERLRDPDGQECADLNEAQREAEQSARHLIAQALMAGRGVPFEWKIQIADAEDTVIATISFANIVFGKEGLSENSSTVVRTPGASEDARDFIAGTRKRREEIRATIRETHS